MCKYMEGHLDGKLVSQFLDPGNVKSNKCAGHKFGELFLEISWFASQKSQKWRLVEKKKKNRKCSYDMYLVDRKGLESVRNLPDTIFTHFLKKMTFRWSQICAIMVDAGP